MEQANNAIELFQGLLSLGGLAAIIWAAGFVVFTLRQLKQDFREHEEKCEALRSKIHDMSTRLAVLEDHDEHRRDGELKK